MRTFVSALFSGLLLLAAQGCAPGAQEETYSADDFAQVRKFDAHVHANVDNDAFLEVARRSGFEVLSINVDYPDFPTLETQATVAQAISRRDPEHFHFATTFSMDGFGEAGWAERTNAALDAAFESGAIAVKVWKNIGMVAVDSSGQRVFIDDPRFDDVVNHIKARGLPLIAHQGEPKNCWLPLDQMTTENDRSYFAAHPEYYMFLHPEEPSYEDLMARRDRFVARHPDLSVVGAHMGSIEWSVDELGRFLDAHPNATVDLAARMTQVQAQSRDDYEKVRAFFIRYQDRLLYGSDLTHNPPDPNARAQNPPIDDSADFAAEADRFWRSDWLYLATGESQRIDAIEADVPGLALPRSVIDKIYWSNARRVFFAGR